MAQTPPPGVPPLGPNDPSTTGPFRLLGRLGAGGMGTVYAALTPQDRPAAVKVVHRELTEDADFRARFAREVALVRRAQSPCIPRFLGADTDAARPWLATEYVPGPTLRAHVRDHGPLQGARLRAFAAGVAEALQALHGLGIVHRDLKPGNVILAPTGPKVLDFGIARALEETAITATGGLFGTPGWIAPELYAGAPPSPAADVFAWGGLVAFAATGSAPFGSGPPDVLAYRAMSEPPQLDGVPGPLAGLVSGALDKAPERRPTAAQALQWVLGPQADQQPQATITQVLTEEWEPLPDHTATDTRTWPTYAPPPPAPQRKKRRFLIPVAAASAVALVVAGGWVAGSMLRSEGDSGGQGQESASGQGSEGGSSEDGSAEGQEGPSGASDLTIEDAGHGGPGLVEEAPEPTRDIVSADVSVESDVFTVRTGENIEESSILATIAMDAAERTDDGVRFTGTATFAQDEGSFTVHADDFRVLWLRAYQATAETDPGADAYDFYGSYNEYPTAEGEPLAAVTAEAPQAEFSFTVPDAPPVGELHYSIDEMDFWGFTPVPEFPYSMCFDENGEGWGLTVLHGGYMCDATLALDGSSDPDRDPADSHTWAETGEDT
ncbi:serine/threonine-protein kinase [Nocardiopsis sp. RSe5-2]|uniref:Serine/threonine-protein kinase n=1 Tax=Nocardiopsis endophytica TaxID=3018445 RepID=A0ABT4TXS5_9ACTN|nr:serine/threonine-protein kinase [Nocardiopsis endophytica]MDA2809489.1 serine/threonine-protein kinase [Nocardiopsis endophytica]